MGKLTSDYTDSICDGCGMGKKCFITICTDICVDCTNEILQDLGIDERVSAPEVQ